MKNTATSGDHPLNLFPLNSTARRQMVRSTLKDWAIHETVHNYDASELKTLSDAQKCALICRVRTHLWSGTLKAAAQIAQADLHGRLN